MPDPFQREGPDGAIWSFEHWCYAVLVDLGLAISEFGQHVRKIAILYQMIGGARLWESLKLRCGRGESFEDALESIFYRSCT